MRRFAELESIAPGIHRVKSVFRTDMPAISPDIVAPPADKSDAEVLSSIVFNGRWMPRAAIENDRKTRPRIAPGEVLWYGVTNSLTGYGKANREILLRLKNSRKTRFFRHPHDMACYFDPAMQAIFQALEKVPISAGAPFVRLLTPSAEMERRYRICYSMMETRRIHPDFISRLNTFYDEFWVPTAWYRNVFVECGLKIRCEVMPLGVNPLVFLPRRSDAIPPCRLLSTGRAGAEESPGGFLFLSIYQPIFRKGTDVLLAAFEQAFAGDPDAALILGSTCHPPGDIPQLARGKRSRIYMLSGEFTEQGLSRLYNSIHAYVCASRGEGWNLPALEAGACEKPLILPWNTSHIDIVNDSLAYVFHPDGEIAYPGAANHCPWYENQKFSHFGPKAISKLAELMQAVKRDYGSALSTARRFRQKILSEYTWDHAVSRIVKRLDELSP